MMEETPQHPWHPYVAHLAMMAFVYALLLVVVHMSFRTTVPRMMGAPTSESAGPNHPTPSVSSELKNGELKNGELKNGELKNGVPSFELEDVEDEFNEERGDPTSSGNGNGALLDRLERQLDAALTSPSVRGPKPREILTHPSHPLQRQIARQTQAMEPDDDRLEETLEEMRRAELIRKEQERKMAQAVARQGGGTGTSAQPGNYGVTAPSAYKTSIRSGLIQADSVFGHAGGSRTREPTHVVSAPLDAVYGAEPGSVAPGGPSASIPLSPEERIMNAHVRGGGMG